MSQCDPYPVKTPTHHVTWLFIITSHIVKMWIFDYFDSLSRGMAKNKIVTGVKMWSSWQLVGVHQDTFLKIIELYLRQKVTSFSILYGFKVTSPMLSAGFAVTKIINYNGFSLMSCIFFKICIFQTWDWSVFFCCMVCWQYISINKHYFNILW